MWAVADIEHPCGVTAVAFSPDGKALLTGDAGGVVRRWQVPLVGK